MSSILTRKPGRTNSDASPEAIDPDSFDLDLFDQLANQPRKKSRGIRFCELSEDEELPETDVADDEIGDEFENEDSSEEYEEDVEEVEEEEEYIPVKSRRSTVSRAPAARSSASSRSARTPARSTRTGTTGTSGTIGTTRISRTVSTVSDRNLTSGTEETGSSGTLRTTSGRSLYGFPVRTTANSTAESARTTDLSSSWSMSSITSTGTGYQVSTDNPANDASLSSRTSLSAEDLEVLQPKSRKKTSSFLRFCRTMLIIVMIVAGAWAIYGVSVESNLGFWQQTFQSEIAYVHDTFRSLPSPLLMMIDQP